MSVPETPEAWDALRGSLLRPRRPQLGRCHACITARYRQVSRWVDGDGGEHLAVPDAVDRVVAQAALEALVAEGLLPASWTDPATRRFALDEGAWPRGGLGATPPRVTHLLAFAGDPEGVARAEELAREFARRVGAAPAAWLRPPIWRAVPPGAWPGFLSATHRLPGALGDLDVALLNALALDSGGAGSGRYDPSNTWNPREADLDTWWRRVRALAARWGDAARRGLALRRARGARLVPPGTGDGGRVRGMPSPLAPFFEVVSLGYVIDDVTDDGVALLAPRDRHARDPVE